MKRNWTFQELEDDWSLSSDELALTARKSAPAKLGIALLLKFHQLEHRFPTMHREWSPQVVDHVAQQVGVSPKRFADYDLTARAAREHLTALRLFLGWHRPTVQHTQRFSTWLLETLLPETIEPAEVSERSTRWFHEQKIELPAADYFERLMRSALFAHETTFFEHITVRIPEASQRAIDVLLAAEDPDPVDLDEDSALRPERQRHTVTLILLCH